MPPVAETVMIAVPPLQAIVLALEEADKLELQEVHTVEPVVFE